MKKRTEKNIAIIKDELLTKIFKSGKISPIELNQFGECHKWDYLELIGLLEEFKSMNYAYLTEVSQNLGVPDSAKQYIVRISGLGVKFLRTEGGYLELFKDRRNKRLWIYTKSIANVLNATAIIIIGILGTRGSKEYINKVTKDQIVVDSILPPESSPSVNTKNQNVQDTSPGGE